MVKLKSDRFGMERSLFLMFSCLGSPNQVKIRPFRYGKSDSVKYYDAEVLGEIVKIRPFRYGKKQTFFILFNVSTKC